MMTDNGYHSATVHCGLSLWLRVRKNGRFALNEGVNYRVWFVEEAIFDCRLIKLLNCIVSTLVDCHLALINYLLWSPTVVVDYCCLLWVLITHRNHLLIALCSTKLPVDEQQPSWLTEAAVGKISFTELVDGKIDSWEPPALTNNDRGFQGRLSQKTGIHRWSTIF